jgi:calcineurin-like phosphoesterase family protein
MIYLTSDNHFGHFNVIGYCNRPFKDIIEMQEAMIDNWNRVVDKEDTVLHLGDFSMDPQQAPKILPRLNGYKSLSSGNHDKCWKGQDRWRYFYNQAGFITVYCRGEESKLQYKGREFLLSHLPYTNRDERFLEYKPEDLGLVLLCGHVHEKWAQLRSDKGTLQINVGVDVRNFTPISIDEIMEICNDAS